MSIPRIHENTVAKRRRHSCCGQTLPDHVVTGTELVEAHHSVEDAEQRLETAVDNYFADVTLHTMQLASSAFQTWLVAHSKLNDMVDKYGNEIDSYDVAVAWMDLPRADEQAEEQAVHADCGREAGLSLLRHLSDRRAA